MSLKPQAIGPIPEETVRVARAAYSKGNVWMRMREELGPIYQDQAFAHLFSHTGQPAEAARREAEVTVMQFARSDFPIGRRPSPCVGGSTSSMRLSSGTEPIQALILACCLNFAHDWSLEMLSSSSWTRCSPSLKNEDGGIRARQATHLETHVLAKIRARMEDAQTPLGDEARHAYAEVIGADGASLASRHL